MTIVERIKEKCKEKNTSMNALEKEIGLGNGTIRLWDVKDPGASKVIAVANKLGCSLDWILIGKEPEELTQDEKHIIDLYRAADERGKRHIEQCAQAEAQERGSCTSKIG